MSIVISFAEYLDDSLFPHDPMLHAIALACTAAAVLGRIYSNFSS